MDKPFTFAQRLKMLLELKGVSRSELARLCGIDRSNVTRYLNGEYEAKQDVVYNIASKLNVSPAWLMGYDSPMTEGGPHYDGEDLAEKLEQYSVSNQLVISEDELELLRNYRQLTELNKGRVLQQIDTLLDGQREDAASSAGFVG